MCIKNKCGRCSYAWAQKSWKNDTVSHIFQTIESFFTAVSIIHKVIHIKSFFTKLCVAGCGHPEWAAPGGGARPGGGAVGGQAGQAGGGHGGRTLEPGGRHLVRLRQAVQHPAEDLCCQQSRKVQKHFQKNIFVES